MVFPYFFFLSRHTVHILIGMVVLRRKQMWHQTKKKYIQIYSKKKIHFQLEHRSIRLLVCSQFPRISSSVLSLFAILFERHAARIGLRITTANESAFDSFMFGEETKKMEMFVFDFWILILIILLHIIVKCWIESSLFIECLVLHFVSTKWMRPINLPSVEFHNYKFE